MQESIRQRGENEDEEKNDNQDTMDEGLEMGAGKPNPAPCPERKVYVVEFSLPYDAWNPQQWTSWKK